MNKNTSIWNISTIWNLFKSSFKRLKHNDPLRMAGATAFFTCFALPPIIILLFQLLSIFFSRKIVGTAMGKVLTDALGPQGSQQLRETAQGLRRLAPNWYMAAIGLLFLVFVATTLFKVIRNSLNDIWDIRLEQSNFVYDMKGRAKSLIIILSAALLFMAAGMVDVFKVVAGRYINNLSEKGARFFTSTLNEIISIAVVTVWFMVLFRFLANARPSWRAVTIGGLLTSILFLIGKSVLSTIIINANAGAVYGAGGAIVLILLFVFYSSFILYFGGCFIKEYSELTKDPIIPSRRAYTYELQKVTDE